MVGRPRDPAVDEAIRVAALEMVRECGYRGVSMEGIAARSGVSKQAIYRRYRSKGEIILDVLIDTAGHVPVPDTGTLRGDLEELLTVTFAAQRDVTGMLNRALVTEALQDPDFAKQLWDRLIVHRRALVRDLLTRARGRGEITRDVDDDALTDLVFGPMWYRLIFEHAPLDDAYARTLARAVTHAATA
ncbi:TetR/AcrR family transcriptional regulator [Nonomuraea sp. NPDC050536]|uniref:TetR/AcrR family transcriptional regulator n=1 Tax=Nonomuraea sp. NPDC050536 TaxID=3364366 RepID=UPI0037C75C66